MKAKDFLEEIDYYNTNVEGQLYEELGIETLADMLELYHERKLKLLGIANVSNCTIIDELFYKCAETEPNLSREEFNEVLKLWLYRWEKDQQANQIMKEL